MLQESELKKGAPECRMLPWLWINVDGLCLFLSSPVHRRAQRHQKHAATISLPNLWMWARMAFSRSAEGFLKPLM